MRVKLIDEQVKEDNKVSADKKVEVDKIKEPEQDQQETDKKEVKGRWRKIIWMLKN